MLRDLHVPSVTPFAQKRPGESPSNQEASKPQLFASAARDFMYMSRAAWSSYLALWIDRWFRGGLPWCVGLIRFRGSAVLFISLSY